MSKGAYTYEPGNITEFGKDRMRFELGDTMVEGLADTTALTDEEIQAAIDAYPKKWKRAKLMLLESLCRRFAYEVNTKTGPLSLDMNGRAKLWKEDYDKLKKEVQAESVSVPRFGNGVDGPPYFHTGMHETRGCGTDDKCEIYVFKAGKLIQGFCCRVKYAGCNSERKGSKRPERKRLKDHQRMSC